MKKLMMIMAMAAVIGMAGTAMAATDADVVLWLKADAITGLSDGDTLTSWPDSSTGYNNDGSTILGTPTWEDGELNTKPVVRFTPAGTDEVRVPDTDNSLDLKDWTILTVFASDGSAAGTMMAKGGPNWNYLVYHRTGAGTGTEIQYSGPGGQAWARDDNGLVTAHQIGVMWHDDSADDLRVYVDGLEPVPYAALFHSVAGATPTLNDDPLYIGQNIGPFPGDIAEIIIFDVTLDTAAGGELEDVTAYLADKYGLTAAGSGNALEGRLLLGPLDADPVPEPTGLGLIGLALLAVRKRRS